MGQRGLCVGQRGHPGLRELRAGWRTSAGPSAAMDRRRAGRAAAGHSRYGTDAPGLSRVPPPRSSSPTRRSKELATWASSRSCHCRDDRCAAFYTNQSLQSPTRYDEPARRSTPGCRRMLQYISVRLALRPLPEGDLPRQDGLVHEPGRLRAQAQRLAAAATPPAIADASAEMKARYPLREAARCEVRDRPGKPGSYLCVVPPAAALPARIETGRVVRLVTEMTSIDRTDWGAR